MLRSPWFSGLLSASLLAACNAAEPATAEPQSIEVAELPLKRGYYVASDTPCGEASNATIQLLRRDGISGCGFTRIEALGGGRYRVHQFCHPREPDVPVDYVLVGDSRFRVDGGDFRHCPQSTLSEWFRDNDISDVLE
ncbi:MAG TPA: hypothetical protein PK743_04495 [Luteimonas sp.]|nr:hypothetical protein [Luteimonas sp.]HRO27506.1 hypothetical protein [Luteimonas sp.]HRP71883.1 hypothetical protein [Luteimonas sp.]